MSKKAGNGIWKGIRQDFIKINKIECRIELKKENQKWSSIYNEEFKKFTTASNLSFRKLENLARAIHRVTGKEWTGH